MGLLDLSDVSNYQGPTLEQVVAASVRPLFGFIVRLSTESAWHRQRSIDQLRWCRDNGYSASGYIWDYWGEDPIILTQDSLEIAAAAGVQLASAHHDAEDTHLVGLRASPSRVQPGEPVPAMGQSLRRLMAMPLHEVARSIDRPRSAGTVIPWLSAGLTVLGNAGLDGATYTGRWFWVGYVNNSPALAQTSRLWYAHYDEVPSLDTWAYQSFGGWEKPVAKQYSGDPFDWNVFDPALFPEAPPVPPPGPEPDLEGLRTAVSELADKTCGDDLRRIVAPLALKRLPVKTRLAVLDQVYGQTKEAQRIREQFLGPRPGVR